MDSLPIVAAGIRTDPAGETLAQLETIFSANTPATLPLQTTLLGVPVQVDLQPRTWRWTFGDGATAATTTPGAPYPSRDVTHVYRRPGTYTASVDVVWGGTFTALGQTRAIPGTVTISGTGAGITVREARARLVG